MDIVHILEPILAHSLKGLPSFLIEQLVRGRVEGLFWSSGVR